MSNTKECPRVVSVVGARPQFIKAAVVSRAMSELGIHETMIHTDQHYDQKMSAVFFEELEIADPKYHLGIGSGTHGYQTGRMLEAIESILMQEKPDWVLVYGDTNSTLAGALAASKLHLPVAHVEAGLRSFNKRMPEEVNRILVDHVSAQLFAPTGAAVENLKREGIADSAIHLVGDVMYDASIHFGQRAAKQSTVLSRYNLQENMFVLATIHRAENTDVPQRLQAITDGLVELSHEMPIVLPIHPRTRRALFEQGLLSLIERNLTVLEPLGYLDMLKLEQSARLVVTDSGGVQKEAFFQKVPCVTLRDETEWVELVELGWNRLVPPSDGRAVFEGILSAMSTNPSPADRSLFGGGQCSKAIANILLDGI